MAMMHPIWIQTGYVENILRNAEQDESIEVLDIIVKAATAPGDNYSSTMYRVNVDFSRYRDGQKTTENRSIIIKVAPQGALGEMVAELGVFLTELSMMSITLPRMNKSLENLSQTSLSAQCLYHQYDEPTHIVLEDLVAKGFRMAQQKSGLDLAHSLLIMQNIARFHASSIALREKSQHEEELMKYKKGIFHKDQPTSWKKMYSENLRTLADETVNWSELDPKIPMKIRKLSDVLFEKSDSATAYQANDFNVLNHGDVWINNMMFRYDEAHNPIDHMFVDFQFCHWGSPAEDILYFIGTSLSDDVRIQHRDLLLRKYHASLISTMAELKCKTEKLSFDKLQQTLKERAFCEVIAALTVLVAALLGKEDKMRLDEMLRSGGAFIKPGYDGKAFKTTMIRLLPLYDSMGLLNA